MLYRQSVLLALVESFGGRLSNTDCEKLLFLYCRENGRDFYDFFPYHYGPFSYMSYSDKRKLMKDGYLVDTDTFVLSTRGTHIGQLSKKDRLSLSSFAKKYRHVRGDQLIRQVYLDYPEYSIRSKIVHRILTREEIERSVDARNTESERVLFTIGYEGISIDEYLCRLLVHNVNLLVDVRKNPISRKHGFSKTRLSSYLRNSGIEYIHLPQLGIPSSYRKGLGSSHSYDNLFKYYASDILPDQEAILRQIPQYLIDYRRIALTCFEADFHMCHRHVITEQLQQQDSFHTPVIHI